MAKPPSIGNKPPKLSAEYWQKVNDANLPGSEKVATKPSVGSGESADKVERMQGQPAKPDNPASKAVLQSPKGDINLLARGPRIPMSQIGSKEIVALIDKVQGALPEKERDGLIGVLDGLKRGLRDGKVDPEDQELELKLYRLLGQLHDANGEVRAAVQETFAKAMDRAFDIPPELLDEAVYHLLTAYYSDPGGSELDDMLDVASWWFDPVA